MKKFNVTYEQIASYSNIYAAYLDARKGKSERNEIMRFSLELDAHLNDLYNDLQEERYKVSGYRIIYIYVPKKRLIMALQFRDRVLQWAVYRLLNPLYEKTYIKDSYACIKERGREKAASRLQYWLRQTERKPKQYYYLKLDISKFFYRVDHEVLLNILKRRIKDERLINMINKDEIRLRSATVKRMRSRIKYIVKAYERGEMTLQEVNATMQSYFGLIKHCTNEGLRENIINGFVLHCTDAARAKARESR